MNKGEGRAFGAISELYNKARTGYPYCLINDIIQFSNIGESGRGLDVGCGTGQATLPLTTRNLNMLGIDVSQEMIYIARQNCSELPNANFEVGTFEDVEIPPKSIDLIVSGMAWHWVAPETRYEKAHQILKRNGTIALFWSCQEKEKSEFVTAIGRILDKYGGINRGPAGSRVETISDEAFNELTENDLFGSVERREYQRDLKFSKQRYLDLVISYGWVQKLSDQDRQGLTFDLEGLFAGYKEPLVIPYKYFLVLAKKK